MIAKSVAEDPSMMYSTNGQPVGAIVIAISTSTERGLGAIAVSGNATSSYRAETIEARVSALVGGPVPPKRLSIVEINGPHGEVLEPAVKAVLSHLKELRE